LPKELVSVFDTCFLLPLPALKTGNIKEEINNITRELSKINIKLEMKKIGDLIKEKEKTGDLEELEELQGEFNHLLSKLSK